MSATNRGAVRAENDHYKTPGFAVRAILPTLAKIMGEAPRRILEPASGTGAIGRVLRAHWPNAEIVGVEKTPLMVDDPDPYTKNLVRDYLRDEVKPWRTGGNYDLVIANPPFVELYDFVVQMRKDAGKAAPVAVLSRLNWLEGARSREPQRMELLLKSPPFVNVLTRRPSFGLNKDGKVGTDGASYAWLLFNAGSGGKYKLLECESEPRRKPGQAAAE